MNYSKQPLIAASCFFLFAHASPADTIVLKSGEKIDGKVVREDADRYVVEIRKGTIRDEKIFPRADVKYVEKETEDAKAFKSLEGLVPAPELLSKEGYVARIEKIEEFLKTYPESSKAKNAKGMLDILSEEQTVVEDGGIKFGDKLISAVDYDANAYEYDAKIAEKQIKDAVARKDLLGAMRTFSEYGEKFGEPVGYKETSLLILQVLQVYRQNLEENLASLPKRIEKRQAGLASMAADDRVKTEFALKEQMEKVQKNFEDEKAAGQKWITPDSFHKESMDEALRQVATESAKLEGKSSSPTQAVPVSKAYRLAWDKLAVGTDQEKKKVLNEAKANRLSEYYLEKLKGRAAIVGK